MTVGRNKRVSRLSGPNRRLKLAQHNRRGREARKRLRKRSTLELAADLKRIRPNGQKKCNCCKTVKPVTDYAAETGRNDGLQTKCKPCGLQNGYINKEKRVAKNLKKRKLHPEKPIIKLCPTCNVFRTGEHWHFLSHSSDDLAKECRFCRKKGLEPIQTEKMELKKSGQCANCGFKNPIALDFAHIDRNDRARCKDGNSRPLGAILTFSKWEEEVPKLKILCAFCHRLETQDENTALLKDTDQARHAREYLHKRKEPVLAEKIKRGECVDCKRVITAENAIAFDFDHRPGTSKINNVSTFATCSNPEV